MHLLLAAFLIASAPDSTDPSSDALQPSSAGAQLYHPSSETLPEFSRWEGSGRQFVAGFAGGALGTAGGAVLGGLAGAVLGTMIFGLEDKGNGNSYISFPPWFTVALMGGSIGTFAGGIYGTGWLVEKASPRNAPTLGKGPAMLGSFVGMIGGVALIASVPAIADNEWGFWSSYATLLACSSLGAVVLDRSTAIPAQVSFGPWFPRPGLSGMRVSLAF